MSASGKRRSRLRLLTLLLVAGAVGILFIALADTVERSQPRRRGDRGTLDDAVAPSASVGADRELLENEEAHGRETNSTGNKTAQPESAPSATSTLERIEVQHQLIAAVCDLEEPYRQVVFCRFYDDVLPREIARRLGVPTKPVQTRSGTRSAFFAGAATGSMGVSDARGVRLSSRSSFLPLRSPVVGCLKSLEYVL